MSATAVMAEQPSLYQRKGTFTETLAALRQASARPQNAQATRIDLGPWFATEPIKIARFGEVCFPEKGIDLAAKGQNGKPLWRKADWRDSTDIALPKGDDSATYLYRVITASAAGNAGLELGSDDGIAVWLNGEKVHENDTARGVKEAEDKVAIALRPGTNALLMKIVNKSGGYGFYFALKQGGGDTAIDQLQRDFPREMAMLGSLAREYAKGGGTAGIINDINEDIKRLAGSAALAKRAADLTTARATAEDPRWLQLKLDVVEQREAEQRSLEAARVIDFPAVRRAVAHLGKTYPEKYPNSAAYLTQLAVYETKLSNLFARGATLTDADRAVLAEAVAFQRKVLLENPLLDFDKILAVRRNFGGRARSVIGPALGNPSLNSHTNDTIPHNGWDNEIVIINCIRNKPQITTLYKPEGSKILRDVDLEFDGDRIMFSSIGPEDRWTLFEIKADGSGFHRLSPEGYPDVDFFDSCYLPDGRIITCATAGYQGLPCEGGGKPMVNLYQITPTNNSLAQLTFEQDSDYHPAVMDNGRVLYLRWEYSDIMHYYSRILFHCNPDGSNQAEYYGSGSLFPTAFKHARQIPGTSKVVGIVGGHHSISESGRLCVIDPRLSRKYPFQYRPKTKEWGAPGSYINAEPEVLPAEKTGFVNEIPGYGKPVVGNVLDGQSDPLFKEGKPHFVYPYPLSEEFFLVSMKRNENALWGIYLVDIFDNMTLICETDGAAMLEPIPFRKTTRPPIIPDRVMPDKKTANVFITDIYAGPGLKNIPHGTVKKLRLFSYHFCYNQSGGHDSVGTESSWDIKRVLGTVSVEPDGSASFIVPANTPIAIQPLDSEGRAIQLMRSWFVGRPGENVSCVGCHEQQNSVTMPKAAMAALRAPESIQPWFGAPRPFAFECEVQPVLDKHCVACHNGAPQPDGKKIPDFRIGNRGAKNSDSYEALNPFVRRPGPESDMDILPPMEYHADTSELIQLLKKGHHNVKLDREAWERLYTWIDLNAPYRGAWKPGSWRGNDQVKRRLELAKKFAGVDVNPEAEYEEALRANAQQKIEPIKPPDEPSRQPDKIAANGFPFDAAKAAAMLAGAFARRAVEIGNGITVTLVRIPAGTFVMGSEQGLPDERPRSVVIIAKPFWMSETEISNGQYEQFDAEHDTRFIDEHGKDQAVPGYIANHPDQPVARVSWQEAMSFCRWLGTKMNATVSLPTEAQWEWAARAGANSQFYYGDANADFSKFANLSDRSAQARMTSWDGGSVIHTRRNYPENSVFPLRDNRFNDGCMVVNYVGQYAPNAWGLKDMVGNVCEWTLSDYRAYPYKNDDARNSGGAAAMKVARGGSWDDRPIHAGSSIRIPYQPYQKVCNVGFRIIVEDGKAVAAAK